MDFVKSLAAGCLVALGVLVGSHQAEATVYAVSGTFEDGSILTGRYTQDSSGQAFSNIDLKVNNDRFTTISEYADVGCCDVATFSNSISQLYLVIVGRSDIDTSSTYFNGSEIIYLSSGSVTAVAPVVTPIPAALPLAASALAGLGGLGWVKRRRGPADLVAAA